MIVLLVVHHEAYYGRGVTFYNCSSTFTEASSAKERQSLLSVIEYIKKEKSHSFIRSGYLQSFEDTDRQPAYDSLKSRFPILNNFRSVHIYNEDTFMFFPTPKVHEQNTSGFAKIEAVCIVWFTQKVALSPVS